MPGSLLLALLHYHLRGAAEEAQRAEGHYRADGGEDQGDERHHPAAEGQRSDPAGGAEEQGEVTLHVGHQKEARHVTDSLHPLELRGRRVTHNGSNKLKTSTRVLPEMPFNALFYTLY